MEATGKILEKVNFNKKGLIPAVLQDNDTHQVLMVAYMNEEALEKTLETGKAHFWSRSREKLWLKGETSGNYQVIKGVWLDCDNDTILCRVKPEGPACHTGHKSCFYQQIKGDEVNSTSDYVFLNELAKIIKERKENLPENSYTAELYRKGKDEISKKLGEESVEVIIATQNQDQDEIIYESADLLYHLLVLLTLYNITLTDVVEELESRHG